MADPTPTTSPRPTGGAPPSARRGRKPALAFCGRRRPAGGGGPRRAPASQPTRGAPAHAGEGRGRSATACRNAGLCTAGAPAREPMGCNAPALALARHGNVGGYLRGSPPPPRRQVASQAWQRHPRHHDRATSPLLGLSLPPLPRGSAATTPPPRRARERVGGASSRASPRLPPIS